MIGAVAGLLLAACGGDGESSAPTTSAPAQGATPAGGTGGHGGEQGHADHAATCSPTGPNVSIVASNTRFDKDCLAAPAGQPFTLTYENKDSIAHNIVLLESHSATDVFFRADIFSGPKTTTHNVGALKVGTFAFHCEVHPAQMKGTLVVK